ncbi:MAG: hypothetical protein ACKV2Q_28075 [Planctomycetaceae bacterium]
MVPHSRQANSWPAIRVRFASVITFSVKQVSHSKRYIFRSRDGLLSVMVRDVTDSDSTIRVRLRFRFGGLSDLNALTTSEPPTISSAEHQCWPANKKREQQESKANNLERD